MTRRLVSLLAAVAVILTVAAGCDRGPGGAKSITVVIAEYSKDHTKPFWQALAEQYTKQTGVKVDLRIIDWNSIDQQVSTMIQNNQPPDVLNLNSFSSYAKDGLLYSADEVLSAKTRDDFLAPFARGGEYQGKLYGFPILSSARAFFYNKELFAKAGLAGPPEDLGGVRPGGAQDPRPRRRNHRLRLAARARGGPGRVVDLDVERRRRLEGRATGGPSTATPTCGRSPFSPIWPIATR